ncbi:ABC transporter ATP-binding protein [Streptomyces sp. NBC_00237]|uniref:ABC transporter ATP-binding protein n=1 Tax=Streptomyces sp. NBC_00237 TaxID=2975687 RepID=UPI00224F80B3|nr:ABC transporter ATP-binding protein [Streptomyces sp. NBC_00237]MCX5206494.1 ABC transporter ATP-binding protein [Streptomyces sp. NBC_00237]
MALRRDRTHTETRTKRPRSEAPANPAASYPAQHHPAASSSSSPSAPYSAASYPTAPPAIELRSVARSYGRGSATVHALRGIDLVLPRGGFTAVMGPSGSGKSTFLQCAAGLDRPSSGDVLLGGESISRLREDRLTELRRSRIGFVFQSFNLLPSLTVAQNVLLPQRLAGVKQDRRLAQQLLTEVGLPEHGDRRPGQLSGGQQQRVAIARALITRPEVVFADEPTGALDTQAAQEVLGLLRRAVDSMGATVVMVTHDPSAASHADRVLFLADGSLAGELRHPDPQSVAARMADLAAYRPASFAGAAA